MDDPPIASADTSRSRKLTPEEAALARRASAVVMLPARDRRTVERDADLREPIPEPVVNADVPPAAEPVRRSGPPRAAGAVRLDVRRRRAAPRRVPVRRGPRLHARPRQDARRGVSRRRTRHRQARGHPRARDDDRAHRARSSPSPRFCGACTATTSRAATQGTLQFIAGLLVIGVGLWLLLRRVTGQADHFHLFAGHHASSRPRTRPRTRPRPRTSPSPRPTAREREDDRRLAADRADGSRRRARAVLGRGAAPGRGVGDGPARVRDPAADRVQPRPRRGAGGLGSRCRVRLSGREPAIQGEPLVPLPARRSARSFSSGIGFWLCKQAVGMVAAARGATRHAGGRTRSPARPHPAQAEGHARQPRPHRDRQRRRPVRALRRRVGYGEGVPRDYVTGETIDSALDLLKRSRPRQATRLRLPRLRRGRSPRRAAEARRPFPATTA